MKKTRTLVVVHATLVPPDDLAGYSDKQVEEWRTEYDVISTLRKAGHEVRCLGVSDSVAETLTERFGDEPVLFISGANGRAAPLLSQPSRATVGGGRELEPLTDLWPLASSATGLVLASLLELTNR